MPTSDLTGSRSRVRWWEDYLVRYLTGTLVGAFCIFVLVVEIFFNGDPQSLGKRVFFSPEKDSSWLGLIVLALAVAAYCYLESTPITVLHAGRMIREGMNKYARRAWYVWWFLFTVVFVGATLGFSIRFGVPQRSLLVYALLFIGAAPVAWLFVGQVEVLIRLKSDQDKQPSKFVAFYRKLVVARDITGGTGIRESYTHLREHANSVFITVIELSMLATLLLIWKVVDDINLFAV